MNKIFNVASGLLVAAFCTAANAVPNLVKNGDFLESSGAVRQQIGAGIAGTDWHGTQFTGWSTGGYNFGFTWQYIDHYGSPGAYGWLKLWGANDGGIDAITANPSGGNIIGADGAFQITPISQIVSGLVVGQQYALQYDWAAGQQFGYDGATSGNWTASLGSEQYTSATYNNVSHGFSGWMSELNVFTATDTTETLSFLAHGTPAGEPPFSLLSGVSLTALSSSFTSAVPETSTWLLMLTGFGLAGLGLRQRRAVSATS